VRSAPTPNASLCEVALAQRDLGFDAGRLIARVATASARESGHQLGAPADAAGELDL